jgi:hypothetical protein
MTRKGKIARLPKEIRDQLNHRLDDGRQGNELVVWLNSLPEVQTVLSKQFEGNAINKQNLSQWRLGGYREWQRKQERLEIMLQLQRAGV